MNKELDIWVKISEQIGTLTSEIKSVMDKLTQHEQRLTKLEDNRSSLKDDFLKLLVKTLTISIVGLIVLGGGGGAVIVKALPLLAL